MNKTAKTGIIPILALTILAVFMSGCGGGGENSTANSNTSYFSSITLSPPDIVPGQSSVLTWSVPNGMTATLTEEVQIPPVWPAITARDATSLKPLTHADTYDKSINKPAGDGGKVSASEQVSGNGSKMVSPLYSTRYILTTTIAGAAAPVSKHTTLSVITQQWADDLVRGYNSEGGVSYAGPGGGTQRHQNGIVEVYDTTGYPRLQEALDVWNTAIGGPTVFRQVSSPSNIPSRQDVITIVFDASLGPNICGLGGFSEIFINPTCRDEFGVYVHEIGHALGFFGHTEGDGIMDAINSGGDGSLTTLLKTMIHRLYELPPETRL